MKKISRFINRYFPDISGRIWVDLYSGAALYRFATGQQVDAAVLGVVLGAYVIHKVSKETSSKDESKDA